MSSRIAGLEIKPGTRTSSSMLVGVRPASRVELPFTVIRGGRDGPTLCITAGVHGTEYVGIEAAIRVSRKVESDQLKGTLIAVPVVNIPAFEARTYICPLDGVNIQGSYPGKPDGTIAQLIAYKVYGEFVSKSDYYLDLHGGDIHESEVAHAAYFATGNAKVDAVSEQMARALGFEYVWRTDKEGPMPKGSTWRTGPENGIPSALGEYGSGDKLLEEEAAGMFDGILSVMRQLRMMEGAPKQVEGQKLSSQLTTLTVQHGGLWHLRVKAGDVVSQGDIIGEVTDLRGEVIETVKAPTKGRLLVVIHNPVVDPGRWIAELFA